VCTRVSGGAAGIDGGHDEDARSALQKAAPARDACTDTPATTKIRCRAFHVLGSRRGLKHAYRAVSTRRTECIRIRTRDSAAINARNGSILGMVDFWMTWMPTAGLFSSAKIANQTWLHVTDRKYTTGCPGCEAEREPTQAYVEWLALADCAIERGLNANAVWRLHERHGRNRHSGEYDIGGEA